MDILVVCVCSSIVIIFIVVVGVVLYFLCRPKVTKDFESSEPMKKKLEVATKYGSLDLGIDVNEVVVSGKSDESDEPEKSDNSEKPDMLDKTKQKEKVVIYPK